MSGIGSASSDGGELVHDYQLSSSTGGACAWDWLITFGFVPRDAQKVVAERVLRREREEGALERAPRVLAVEAREGRGVRRELEHLLSEILAGSTHAYLGAC